MVGSSFVYIQNLLILNEKLVKFIKAIFQSKSYELDLHEKLKAVRMHTSFVSDQADLNQHVQVAAINDRTAALPQIEVVVGKILENQLSVINSLYVGLTDQERDQCSLRSLSLQSLSVRRNPRYSTPKRTNKLLEVLGFNDQKPAQDITFALQAMSSFQLSEQDRIKWIMNAGQFQDWLSALNSRTLIINANCPDSTIVSPVSFICAMLVRSLEAMRQAVTIHFFCGLATSGPEGNAVGMLRSLIGQLLEQHNFDLSFLSVEQMDDLRRHSVKMLCQLLADLVSQINDGHALFCVIDAVYFYEDKVRRKDLCDILRRLARMTHVRKNLIFKLLVTSPLTCCYVDDQSSISKFGGVLSVPEYTDGGNQGFSQADWNGKAHQVMTDFGEGLC